MDQEQHLVLHGVGIKKHAKPGTIASLLKLDPNHVEEELNSAKCRGLVVEFEGNYSLSPLGRISYSSNSGRYFHEFRENRRFVKLYDDFEAINETLKSLVTDWQVINRAGTQIPNDHSDKEYDNKIIDKIGDLHEHAEKLLGGFESFIPRFKYYREALLAALERAEDGAIEWISEVKIDSYHTVWFELHEDLLCILGRTRTE